MRRRAVEAASSVTRRNATDVDEAALAALLDAVRSGDLHPDDAVAELRRLPFADLGFARVDHHRALRQGLPEAVYGPGKTPEQGAAIVAELLAGGASPGAAHPGVRRAGRRRPRRPPGRRAARPPPSCGVPSAPRPERVVIAAAGTADLPVADECATVLAAFGFEPTRLTDVGVAGVHRLLGEADALASADAVVVVAGMEGALASLVGGLTPAPGRRRAHERRLRRQPRGRHRAARHARVVRGRRSPSSASTTASAPPAPSLRMLK